MSGYIKWYDEEKNYGFITKEDGGDIFFHRSAVSEGGGDKIKPGQAVSFSISKNEKGFRAESISFRDEVNPADVNRQNMLENIKGWKLDAKHDELGKYFFHVEQEKEIKNGEKSFVIGRKGTGKTALSEYISSQMGYNQFTQKLTFKNFPFNELYSLDNNEYTRPNQYISLWKYLIYSSICRMMIQNNNINEEVRSALSQLFGSDSSINNLKRSIKKWTAKEFSLTIAGSGGKISLDKSEQTWIERLDVLEEIIEDYIDDSLYFIVFDELDEDYKNIVELGQQNDYMSLITSLFKAVQDIRSVFNDERSRIRPVVFLRDDIYDLILDPDKNKWEDFRVDLDWNLDRLKKLLAFRISKAADPEKESLPFLKAWELLFENTPIGVGTKARKKIPVFDYVTRSTQHRPRDYVRYLQVSANQALELSQDIITSEVVKKVDKGFSNYLKNELIDEIHGVLPDILDIFGVISEIRKWVFSIDEFREIYNDRLNKGILKTKDPDFVLKILFHFSVIGNQAGTGIHFFRYTNKEAQFNFKEKVVVHRGLFKSLQII